MKLYRSHFHKLQSALCEKGLRHLIPTSVEETFARMEKNKTFLTIYDPLNDAQQKLCHFAILAVGSYVASNEPEYIECCPLCETEKQYPGIADDWIRNTSNYARDTAWSKYLIPTN